MTSAAHIRNKRPRTWRQAGGHGLLRAAIPLLLFCSLLRAQTPPETIGRLEGEEVAVKGSLSVTVENNRSTTVLASGSEVTVRSGRARLLLAEGGEIDICGPAHFTVLKSSGAITLAMDYGRLHVVLANAVPLTLYTPLMVATPLAIAGGRREAGFGMETAGTICVWAGSGAVRLDEQLTGQSLVVPQSGEIALPAGQLATVQNVAGSCRCDWLAAQPAPSGIEGTHSTSTTKIEYSVPAKANPVKEAAVAGKQPESKPVQPNAPAATAPAAEPAPAAPGGLPASEAPTWRVVMPPLVFDASSPAPPPEPSPEMIQLVREVRVTPDVVFTGRVESASNEPQGPPSPASSSSQDQTRRKGGNFFSKLFHWLGFGHKS